MRTLIANFYIPPKKIEAILSGIKYVIKKRAVPAKKLASVVGLITSCIYALGRNFVKFLIRSVNRDLCSKVYMYGWKAYMRLSTESIRDLLYFRDNLSTLNGHEMVRNHFI